VEIGFHERRTSVYQGNLPLPDLRTPASRARLLFTGQYVSSDLPHYAVTADGQRFIMIQAAEAGRAIQVVDHVLPR
jgi:hypothetical protein